MKKKYNILLLNSLSINNNKPIHNNWTKTLINQTTDSKGNWENCYYSSDINDGPFDVIIIINTIRQNINIKCNPNNIIQICMEPYLGITYNHQWIIEGCPQARTVISHYSGKKLGKRQIRMQALQNWHIGKNYCELINLSVPKKTISNKVIWITSNQMYTPIHCRRVSFAKYIQKKSPEILDLYGRGFKEIDTKWDIFSPAKYVMAIENHTNPHGWTEKLADAFLSYSLPIYYGPDNISDYFPNDSYIRIDINKPDETIKIIKNAIKNNEWEKRLPAIKKARELVLNKYNFAPWMTKYINDTFIPAPYENYTLKKYKDRPIIIIIQMLGRIYRLFIQKFWKLRIKMLR